MKIKELLELFWTFFKMGAVTFGGGYAMLPLLQREVVEKNKWATEEELLDYYTIGQCIPGIIAVNTSTFIGHKRRGVLGAVFSTVGMVLPSIIIITIIAAFINNFSDIPIVTQALAGIRSAVCALVLLAVMRLFKTAVKGKIALLMYLVMLVASFIFKVSPIIIVVVSAALGLILFRKEKH